MWTEKELGRIGKTFINAENTLEGFCDAADLGNDRHSYRNFMFIYFIY